MKWDLSDKLEKIQSYSEKIAELRSNSLVWQPFMRDLLFCLSWNSNSLEGNTLSLEETIAVIEYDEVRSGHTYSEYQEAKSMYKAVSEKLSFQGGKQISIDWIKSVNAIIKQNDGEFRRKNVYIGSLMETVYYPPDYTKVSEQMKKYEADMMELRGKGAEAVLSFAVKKHIEFERIHPFADGNGRTGRVILNQQLLNGGLFPAIIKDNSKYRQAFRRYDRNGETGLMEAVIADGMIETGKRLDAIHEKFLNSEVAPTVKKTPKYSEPKL